MRQQAPSDPVLGRVQVQSNPGEPFLALISGQLVLEHGGALHSVPIVDGAWRLPADLIGPQSSTVLEVRSATDKLSFYPVELSDGEALPTLRAYSYAGAFLLARDSLGNALEDLTIYDNLTSGGRMPESNTVHPGNLLTLDPYPQGAAHPPFLKALPGKPWAYWVHADGHQWGQVAGAQTRAEAVIELQLEQGASLDLRIDDFALKVGMKLTVAREEQVLATYVAVREPSVQLHGLPPGDVRVMLSFDEHFGMNPRTLASTETETLFAGTTREVRLQMPAMPAPRALGTISGTLAIEQLELWSDTDTYKHAELVLREITASPGFAATRRQDRTRSLRSSKFQFKRVPEGDYTLSISPLGIEYPVSVVGGGTSYLTCVIPPLARTEVEAWTPTGSLEELNLIPIRTAQRSDWMPLLRPSVFGQEQRVTFVSLPGELRVGGSIGSASIMTRTFQVQSGHNRLRMEVSPLQ